MQSTSINSIINSLPPIYIGKWIITTNKGYTVEIQAGSQREAVYIAYNDYLIPRSTITKIEFI